MELTVRGHLVACVRNEYKAFKDQDGEERPGGTTFRVWLHSGELGERPEELTVRTEDVAGFERLAKLPYMTLVDCIVRPSYRRLVLVDFEAIAGESGDNGRGPSHLVNAGG